MRTHRCARVAAVVVALATLDCVITDKAYERDGKLYGVIDGAFRGRWYNHFERGASFAEGGYCQDALRDFDAAIRLRPDDQRRARTYGLHFIDYFPNRERGICLLAQKDYDGAVAALETSLSSIDSGRAEYFLNQAMREQLRARGVVDQAGPTIESSLASGLVRKDRVELQMTIKDPGRVVGVLVNDRPVHLPIATDVYHVQEELDLVPGANVISVVASDLFGNQTDFELTLTVDEQPPGISITDLREERGASVLAGTVEDAHGVAVLLVNGKKVALSAGNDKQREFHVAAATKLTMKAEDRAGNVTEIVVDPKAVAEQLAARDTDPPVIQAGELPTTVTSDRIFVDGWVADRGEVTHLEIAGNQVTGAGKHTVYFRQIVRLQPGKNEITILAVDDGKRTTEKVVTVTREVPVLDNIENRLAFAMAPFIPTGERRDTTVAVEQNLENALVEQKRFFVFDRARVSALVTEWQLVLSDLTRDAPDLLKLGEELATDMTLMGWIKESEESIEVYARLVDSETGVIVLEKDVFHEKKSLRNIRDLLYGLALKLKVAMPILRGELTTSDGDSLTVTMHNAALLPLGARLLVLDGDETTIVGQARIQSTTDGALRAELIRGTAAPASVILTK